MKFPVIPCLMALVLISGCGGDDRPKDGVVTLRAAVWKADDPEAWDEALDLFHSRHPSIRIERQISPNSSTQFHDLLTQQLRNRDASLDLFLMDVVWPAEFVAAGWVLPLNPTFPESLRARFFDGPMAAVTADSLVAGVPFNMDCGMLYYRSDLLRKYDLDPPATWSALLDAVRTIQAGENDPNLLGYSGQFAEYEGLVCNMLEFIHGNGGNLLEPESPEAIEAVTFVRDRIIGGAAPRGVLTYQEQESLDLFKRGGAIFLRSWPYAWAILNGDDSAVRGSVAIARLPAFLPGASTATLGGWSFGIHRLSRHPEEAREFVGFMTSPEVQKHFAVRSGKAPAIRALYSDPEVLAANPHFAEMLPVLETATPRPRSPIYPRLSHILQGYLHRTLSDANSSASVLAEEASREIRREMERIP